MSRAGVPPASCADNDGHNTDAIDALTLVVPVVVASVASAHPSDVVAATAREVVSLTRRSDVLGAYSDVFVRLLTAVLQGEPLRDAVQVAARAAGIPDIKAAVERCVGCGLSCCHGHVTPLCMPVVPCFICGHAAEAVATR